MHLQRAAGVAAGHVQTAGAAGRPRRLQGLEKQSEEAVRRTRASATSGRRRRPPTATRPRWLSWTARYAPPADRCWRPRTSTPTRPCTWARTRTSPRCSPSAASSASPPPPHGNHRPSIPSCCPYPPHTSPSTPPTAGLRNVETELVGVTTCKGRICFCLGQTDRRMGGWKGCQISDMKYPFLYLRLTDTSSRWQCLLSTQRNNTCLNNGLLEE